MLLWRSMIYVSSCPTHRDLKDIWMLRHLLLDWSWIDNIAINFESHGVYFPSLDDNRAIWIHHSRIPRVDIQPYV